MVSLVTAIDDYFPVSLTMRSFTPEKAMEEECVHVTIFPDNLIEEDEYVFMNLLSNGDAVDIVQSTARVIIKDANGASMIYHWGYVLGVTRPHL